MKKIGLVGGIGPESTIDYYKGIIEAFKPTYAQYGNPEIGIESIDLRALMVLAENGRWDKIAELIGGRFEMLHSSGAEIGAIASNTPHKVFDEIQGMTSLPLMSIVESTRDYAQSNNLDKLCLLGTKYTMESDFYQTVFESDNIDIVVPSEEEQKYIHEKIFSEIEYGIINKDTKAGFLSIIQRVVDSDNVTGIILGCTELPMIIKPEDISVSCLDTTSIHVSSIVSRCKE